MAHLQQHLAQKWNLPRLFLSGLLKVLKILGKESVQLRPVSSVLCLLRRLLEKDKHFRTTPLVAQRGSPNINVIFTGALKAVGPVHYECGQGGFSPSVRSILQGLRCALEAQPAPGCLAFAYALKHTRQMQMQILVVICTLRRARGQSYFNSS